VDAQVLGPPNIEKKVGLTGAPLFQRGYLTLRTRQPFHPALPSGSSPMLQKPFDVVYYTVVPYS
jgi:hypothetical protein